VTDEEAVKIITVNLAALPQQSARMDADGIANAATVWAELLTEYDASEVAAAVKRHMVTSKWLPAPSEILAIIDAARHGRPDTAGDQWERVRAAISAEGHMRPQPAFRDPITARVVSALGWRELCLSECQGPDRARFFELYTQMAAEHVEDRRVELVPGVARPALAPGRGQFGVLGPAPRTGQPQRLFLDVVKGSDDEERN
jgi:hypothetical protein